MLTQTPDFGTKKCSWVHSDKEEIAHSVPWALNDTTDTWELGVQCEEIKIVNSFAQLLSSAVSEAVSHRIQAKIIAAQEKMAASWALNEVSVSMQFSSTFRTGTSRHHPLEVLRKTLQLSLFIDMWWSIESVFHGCCYKLQIKLSGLKQRIFFSLIVL